MADTAPTLPPLPAHWYSVTKDGAATLCVDEADAAAVAAESDIAWPNNAPHRAVQLVEVAHLRPAPAAQQAPAGWVRVPVEPTTEMLTQGSYAVDLHSHSPRAVWAAMLAAAPQQQGAEHG